MDLPMPSLGPPRRHDGAAGAPGSGHAHGPTADVSVRDARPSDAEQMSAVQSTAWRAAYGSVLPEAALGALEPSTLAEAWRASLAAPPTRGHGVLVALTEGAMVGFAAFGPAEPEQSGVGELMALVVAPTSLRSGHGSRLLNAVADRLRDKGFDQVVTWAAEADTVRVEFLAGAGFGADGARRHLDLTGDGSTVMAEVRLVAALASER